MKTIARIIYIVLCVLIVSNCSKSDHVVDAWDFNDSVHVYGMWNTMKSAYISRDRPIKTLTLPLIKNVDGKFNYYGNPGATKVAKWMALAVLDSSYFNYDRFKRYMDKS